MAATSSNSDAAKSLQRQLSSDEAPAAGSKPKPQKHVTQACESCKAAKSKCDGKQPCGRCDVRNIWCSYSAGQDRRKRASLKRKIEEVEEESALLKGLLRKLIAATDAQALHIISQLRHDPRFVKLHSNSGGGIDGSTASTLNPQSAAALINEDIASYSTNALLPTRSEVFDIARLVDSPTYEVPACPWTSVTKDNALVSHLVSLWAAWDHPWPDGIILEYFLRDMQAGRLDSPFCSPFLVNCVLASGCPYSDYEETRTNSGKQSAMMEAFANEAKQHLDKEQLKPSLTTLQGLGMLYLVVSKMNQDRQGFAYAMQASAMCSEVAQQGASSQALKAARTDAERKQLSEALDVAVWGVLSTVTFSYMCWTRPQHAIIPIRDFPEPTLLPTCRWIPYPHQGSGQFFYHDYVFKHHKDVHVLTHELTNVLFVQSESKDFKVLLRIEFDLEAQYKQIPDDMFAPQNPLTTYYMKLWWLAVIITTLQSRKKYFGSKDKPPSIQARLVQIALEITRLTRNARNILVGDRLNCLTCHPLQQALNIFIDREDRQLYDSEMVDLCDMLLGLAKRYPFVISLLRMIKNAVRGGNVLLPPKTDNFFNDFAQLEFPDWDIPNSLYPYQGPTESGGFDTMNMSDFLSYFEELEVEEAESSQYQQAEKGQG